MTARSEIEIVSEDESESERRYSDNTTRSAEDAILNHFTPEQRKNWTEFIVTSNEQTHDNTKQNQLSMPIQNKHQKELTTEISKDETQNVRQQLLSNLQKRNLVIRKWLTDCTFGYIAFATYRHNNRMVVKCLDLCKSKNKLFEGNSFAFKQLKHKNIIEVIDLIKDKNFIFIVMPLAKTDLFEYISKKGPFSDGRAKAITHQILCGIQYIHSKGWAHRDIKLENCLILDFHIKICDFDLMRSAIDKHGRPVHNKEKVGTLVYMAPELLSGKGSPDIRMSDLWSFGVLTFALLTYCYPFGPIEDIGDPEEVLQNIRYKRYSFPKQCVLSLECKEFVDRLLEFDPFSRLTIDQLLSDKWLSIESLDN